MSIRFTRDGEDVSLQFLIDEAVNYCDYKRLVGLLVVADLERNPMTETNGEQHTHEETVKDEHTTEDGTVSKETTEKTEAETPAEDE